MEAISMAQELYYSLNGTYAGDLDELGLSHHMCLGQHYLVKGDSTGYAIRCPAGHGLVETGVPSWQ